MLPHNKCSKKPHNKRSKKHVQLRVEPIHASLRVTDETTQCALLSRRMRRLWLPRIQVNPIVGESRSGSR